MCIAVGDDEKVIRDRHSAWKYVYAAKVYQIPNVLLLKSIDMGFATAKRQQATALLRGLATTTSSRATRASKPVCQK